MLIQVLQKVLFGMIYRLGLFSSHLFGMIYRLGLLSSHQDFKYPSLLTHPNKASLQHNSYYFAVGFITISLYLVLWCYLCWWLLVLIPMFNSENVIHSYNLIGRILLFFAILSMTCALYLILKFLFFHHLIGYKQFCKIIKHELVHLYAHSDLHLSTTFIWKLRDD